MTLLAAGPGCEADPPAGSPDDGTSDVPAEAEAEGTAEADGLPDVVEDAPDVPSPCEPLPDDYTPRESGSSTDTWPACISDDNAYHPIEATIGTIARIASFEQIADLLWRSVDAPTPADFTAARVIYVEANGL
ncbi:MAG: hypothetical protein JXB32_00660, partial [Deltaproteobacteria bacterium]|nr:hypothetical protein [Deltaproteobacteria bacterium]